MTDSIAAPAVEVEVITPDIAREMLMGNVDNRPIRPGVVARYAAMMRAGEWLVTGEAIILNGPRLIDGQHRLRACIDADVPFQTVVVRGVVAASYAVIDSGPPRSHADAVAHDRHPNASIIAAAVRLVLGYEQGTLATARGRDEVVTRPAVVAEANAHRAAYELAGAMGKAAGRGGFNPSSVTAFVVIVSRHVNEMDEPLRWTQSLIDGAGLDAGDPRLAFRQWLLGKSRGVGNVVHLSALIRARNAHTLGESRILIKPWFRGQPFPTLIARPTVSD